MRLIALLFACIASPLYAGVLTHSASLNRPIATVVTDASATPSTNQTVVSGAMNGVRVWTGEQAISEPFFYLYVSKNGGAASKVQLFRWMGRIITASPGDSLSFGTTDGRTIYVTPMYVPATTETITGTNGTANCDRAGPPIWEPKNPHVILPTNARAFTIVSNGVERAIFLSEYDGSAWTPTRWLKLEANRSLTVRTSYPRIALANYAGTNLTILAPYGSIIGGTSNRMALPFPAITGTTWLVADVTALMSAIAGAVAGDAICLTNSGPGTTNIFALTNSLSHNSFSANEALGNGGPEGITFFGATGNRDEIVIGRSADTNGAWIMDLRVNTGKTTYFRDFTFDESCAAASDATTNGLRWGCANVMMQNVRVTGTNLVDSDGEAVLYFCNLANGQTNNIDLLYCQLDNQSGRLLNFSGFQTNSPTGEGSVNTGHWRAIDCDIFASGSTASRHSVIAVYRIQCGIYGGRIYDSAQYVTEASYNAYLTCFFTSFPQASATARSKNQVAGGSLFGCDWTSYAGTIGADGPNEPNRRQTFHLFNKFTQSNAGSGSFIVGGMSTNYGVWMHNVYSLFLGKAQVVQYNGAAFRWNIITNGSYGVHNYALIGPHADPLEIIGNTFVNCTTAILSTNIQFATGVSNNAATGSGTSFSSSEAGMGVIGRDYNSFDPNFVSYIPGANDTTNANAALDSSWFPTASGNCDGTGATNITDYVGSSDPYGLVLIYAPTRVSRGARERPGIYDGAVLWPDVW